ncbi:MAG: ISAs1 family transposase, partial [Chloroflexota bacterium]|nr:ISAs1 family transposase [Chloroflexota bacterium]
LARGHWGIENGLFYRRDVTLGEDRSLLRRGNGPQVLAILNDLTLGLLRREGHTNVAEGRRISAAFPDHAFNLLTAA